MSETDVLYGETVWDAESYDAERRRLVPSYELLYDAAVDLVTAGLPAHARVLDLGAGTGLLSAGVRARRPDVALTLVDGSAAMLARARARFGADPQVELVRADLRDPLPPGPFHAVMSALAIHHLSDGDKRGLLGRAYEVLGESGVLLNLEQVAAPTPSLESAYRARHERAARRQGASPQEWAAAVERMRHDRSAPLATQLRWLTEIGFVDVDCLVKDGAFAVYAGRRPGPTGPPDARIA